MVISSESESFDAKNHAIWALSHLKGAKSALQELLHLRTGKECDHSEFVCQRELNRIIGRPSHTLINLVILN